MTLGGRHRLVLYDPAMDAPAASVEIRAWKPRIAGIREVLHARFADHNYPLHTHDVWTLFVVDEGTIRYHLDRHDHSAERSMVSILPPHVAHDGRTAAPSGYRKRVIYLETSIFGEHLIGPAVDRPVLPDPSLRRPVSALHDALACVDDALEAETRLHFIAERIRASFGEAVRDTPTIPRREIAEQFRAHLDAHLFERVTLAAAAEAVGASPTRMTRQFREAFGIAPHAYVLGRRLGAARDRILAGQPLADVAAEVGFHDQAHLTHRFKRFLGTTPGRFGGS